MQKKGLNMNLKTMLVNMRWNMINKALLLSHEPPLIHHSTDKSVVTVISQFWVKRHHPLNHPPTYQDTVKQTVLHVQ